MLCNFLALTLPCCFLYECVIIILCFSIKVCVFNLYLPNDSLTGGLAVTSLLRLEPDALPKR